MATTTQQTQLSERLRSAGLSLGFSLIGIAPAVTPTGFHRLLQWINDGYAADMDWVERRVDAYRHPDGVMPGTRSVIMVAMNYGDGTPPAPGPRIARYACGIADYHDVLKQRLKQLTSFLRAEVPSSRTRSVVDTAPLLERDFGRLAGIGWFGKNTMLISRDIGSWFFLGAILTDIELAYDQPVEQNFCGTCTRCLDACPTNAFPEPGVLDARRCISYLTIEHRNKSIPEDLRDGIGAWLFGCDICQEVCPWNRFSPKETLVEFQRQPALNPIGLVPLLETSQLEFDRQFADSPLARPGRAGLLRNAAIVAGNINDRTAIPALLELLNDPDEMLRDASGWALNKLTASDSSGAVDGSER
jgi:epoxyqueuosine reductase